MENKKDVLIKVDENGKKMVVIPIIKFKGRRKIDWKAVEESLHRYVGAIVEITDSKDVVYIGGDFPDEFSNSLYTKKLKGGLAKTKANLVSGIKQVLEIATDKRWDKNYKEKHKSNARKGWYRYNTRFALPQMDGYGNIIGYNIYQAVLIVRHASDNRLYLYDIQNIIKKGTSKPL